MHESAVTTIACALRCTCSVRFFCSTRPPTMRISLGGSGWCVTLSGLEGAVQWAAVQCSLQVVSRLLWGEEGVAAPHVSCH